MYCSITKRKSTKKPTSSGVYKNAQWLPCYPGSDQYRFTGEELEREPKYIYTINLVDTYSENGVSKKKKWEIAVIGYWDIVDDFIDTLKRDWAWKKNAWGINEGKIFDGIKKNFSNAGRHDYEKYSKLIFAKVNELKKEIIEEYKNAEEYQLQIQKLSKTNKQNGSKEENPEYDWDKHKRTYNYQRVFEKMVSSKTLSNKEMALQLINAGFRKLSQKYHPDSGGTVDNMQKLNHLKKEMIEILNLVNN
ncbi:MAG: hypothetical protein HQK76_11805 [Desulfobacterales bacterium]|nr:hypothetical protein [Desulfobacterales bacterium]